jgi:hypothetical protein
MAATASFVLGAVHHAGMSCDVHRGYLGNERFGVSKLTLCDPDKAMATRSNI